MTMQTVHPKAPLTRSALILIAGLLCGPAWADAQTAIQPSVTVAPFAGVRSDKDANALADEMAMRLVETGRFRVLTREWLPLARQSGRPSIEAVRSAAVSAGVQYVVTAEARPASRPLGVAARPMPFPGGAMRAMPAMVMMSRASRRGGDQFMSVTVRVVDAASGEVVRTATGTGSSSLSNRKPGLALVAGVLTRLGHPGIGAALALKPPSRSPINAGAAQAIAEVARILTLPAPAESVR